MVCILYINKVIESRMGILTCTSFFVLQTFCVLLVIAHPQCLDYFPPFTSRNSQGLCKETAQYGCCTATRDKGLQDLYNFAVENGRETEASASCKEFIRKIVCAECNPYAAHIYDAETPPLIKSNYSKKSNRFPGLCYDFCLNSFEMCRKTVLRLPMNTRFRDFVQAATGQDFCKWAIPSDKDYCLPQVDDFKFNSFTDKATENFKIMCVQPIMHSFSNPLAAVHANDGTNRLFVAEQRGVVFAIGSNGALVSNKPFLDMRERILNSGQAWDERGFLGLAFHPKYRNNGRFFVYYSFSGKGVTDNKANETEREETHWYDSPKHKIRISEFIVSRSSPNIADIDSEIVLLEVDEPEANHEGGMLLFGDDGYLYLFIGDGGGAGDRHWFIGNSLNMTNLLGKILRIDVDVYDGRRYKIPPDNPFVGQKNVRPEIYAYGARNMWRCSKDRGDPETKQGKGRIFCGDVGQNKFEEIDIIVSGGNYGWRAMEGNDCFDKTLCKSKIMRNYEPPIIVYNHTVGKSIVGGYVYRGCLNPALQGRYIYADTVSGRMFSSKEDLKTRKWSSQEIIFGNETFCNNALQGKPAPTILSFGEDETGELYFTSVYWPSASKPFGSLYKLVDPMRRSDPELCKFSPSSPRLLKSVKRRKIDGSQNVNGEYLTQNVPCIDTKRFCRFMKSYQWLCQKYKKLGEKFCKRTCGYCES